MKKRTPPFGFIVIDEHGFPCGLGPDMVLWRGSAFRVSVFWQKSDAFAAIDRTSLYAATNKCDWKTSTWRAVPVALSFDFPEFAKVGV